MITSGAIWKVLHLLSIPVDIREVCVQLAPAFSGLTALATYFFAKEVGKDGSREGTGLWAALFIAIAPGYISRSVAGSYDNEAIAIFILMITFYLWIKTVKTGSVAWSAVTALFYFYMVAAWGEDHDRGILAASRDGTSCTDAVIATQVVTRSSPTCSRCTSLCSS